MQRQLFEILRCKDDILQDLAQVPPKNLHSGTGGGQLHPDEKGSQDFPLSAQVAVTLIMILTDSSTLRVV
jgi:hypothetical protein